MYTDIFIINMFICYKDIHLIKTVCFNTLQTDLRIAYHLIKNCAWLLVEICSNLVFWAVFWMIELFFNPWNGFSVTENHTFDTKIIKKLSWEVTELWQVAFW